MKKVRTKIFREDYYKNNNTLNLKITSQTSEVDAFKVQPVMKVALFYIVLSYNYSYS